MQDAMAQVKSSLGRDAVILHTRKLRKGGFLGFFAREMVEVMAAIDNVVSASPEKKILLFVILKWLELRKLKILN